MINVLYIDDEPHNLTSFRASFRRSFNVYTAESAEEAKRILDTKEVHVILSDQRMPKTTGIEFFESILDKNDSARLYPAAQVRLKDRTQRLLVRP